MASEKPTEPPAEPSAAPRPMSRRKKRKLIVAMVVIAATLVVIFWGWSSTGRSFLGVGTLVDESNSTNPPTVPAKYADKVIETQGVVDSWYGGQDFVLMDKDGSGKNLTVHMQGTFPEGFAIGKTVVVRGTLDGTMPLTIQATEITVGCASKY
ncbi:MAG: cytochrome c maturation protein CcmE [Candidatus Thermoplasmatota archaeon]|nr:cytochrome c maturation protein CcmE [Candidatus Thermoplasmatota archaeon]MBU1914353.1 cytochrome c maturation protein CcmE [Candidatus Thermoplasmatota archaeon]